MNSAQHLIIAAKTRLIPIEIFARGRWVVVEMTDDRQAIERKFQALQRFSQLYRHLRKPPLEVIVFASEKSDIGVVSVIGQHNAAVPPKLADVFATGRGVRHSFWKNVYAALGEKFDPPVQSYDAIEAERLFASEAAKTRTASRKTFWVRVELVGAAVAALLVVGFVGAWILENMPAGPADAVSEEQVTEQDVEPAPRTTKSERLTGLAAYFSEKEE